MRLIGASLAAVVSIASAAPSFAQEGSPDGETPAERRPEDVARAREHFEVALTLYRAGRFDESALEFQRAFDLSGAPELLHNIYLAHRDAGHVRAAADALRRYLAVASDIPEEQRSMLRHRLEALEAVLASGASDEGAPPEGASRGEPDEASDGNREQVEPPPPPAPRDPPWGAIASYAIGGLGLAMTAVAGSMALAERSSLESSCAPVCTDAQVSSAYTLAILADVGLGVGALGAAIGTVLLVLDLSAGSNERAVSVLPFAGPTSAGVAVEGRL